MPAPRAHGQKNNTNNLGGARNGSSIVSGYLFSFLKTMYDIYVPVNKTYATIYISQSASDE